MKTEPISEARVECTLQDDPRLIAGAGAIAAHMARHAGLTEHAQRDFHAAAQEACREAFQRCAAKRTGRAVISLAATRYADRVEVAIEYPEKKQAAGSARRGVAKAHGDGRAAVPPLSKLVDHTERATRAGCCRLTLIKYSHAASPSSRA